MRRNIITTSDGSKTIQLVDWNEQYHSVHGALAEAQHVFLKNGLAYRLQAEDVVAKDKQKIHIVEMGLGTGLNLLLTYDFLSTKELDLEVNYTGIDKFQIFINRFPNSEYLAEALELVEDLQNKLEKKEFEIAKQYYTIRDYKSAIKSIENFIADNPGSMYREEALYFKWLAQYEIAINSIETRINERVTELERSLNSFLNNYPDTIFLEDLSKKINIAKQLL